MKTLEDSYLATVYQRFPLSIVQGRGAILQDVNERKYIDCMGGYGVSLLGHCHPKIVKAIKDQANKLITCHGSIYNDKRAELAKKLVEITPKGLNKIFLCNSGAESVECALKLAAKYTGKSQVISMMRGFHGKTLGALSATWNVKYRKPFKHFLLSNFKFVPFGKYERVQEAINKETAAILIEPIQGESGVYPAPDGYLQKLRQLCDEYGALLVFDEVQTGFGRTGKMWSSQHWNVEPDIMCLAKGMAGGIPMGATVAKREIMDSLGIGEHSSTFGGNALACASACATIDVIVQDKLVERAKTLGEYFKQNLTGIQGKLSIIREVRGLGLMMGVEIRFDVFNILMKALNRGVIMLYSGRNILRFLPPLTIEKRHLEKVTIVLEKILREQEKKEFKR